jgi:hypothetical protein
MLRKYSLYGLACVLAISLLSWGVTGHRTIGAIAQNHLSKNAQSAVKELLGTATLADVSTWADEVRSKPEYKHTGSWHYANLPLGLSYDSFVVRVKAMGPDNVYGAVQKCESVLHSASTSKDEKVGALKFLVHFIGDLHQPMHVSRAEDKGGNTIQLNYEGKGTNLHSLWDTELIETQKLSYEELAKKYDHLSNNQIKAWSADPLVKWMWESYQVSSDLYAEVDAMKSRAIGDEYYKKHIDIIQERIEKAGIRLAGTLNEIFKDGLAGGSNSGNKS